jgi:hypothetical protein
MAQRTFLGWMRLAALLAVLVFVVLGAWLDHARATDWDAPLRVTVYPVAAADDAATREYVAALDEGAFADLEGFFASEAAAHGQSIEEPVKIRVSHAVRDLPPAPGAQHGPLAVAAWSLKLRYWAARVAARDPLPTPDVQVFAIYHAGDAETAVPDSLGLAKGLVAVTHLYAGAAAAGSNQVVLAHELLHTLGATDKYDRATGQPLVPDGLGDPDRQPRYPQQSGELMAGRIAQTPRVAIIPESLGEMTIGPVTAREIGWSK